LEEEFYKVKMVELCYNGLNIKMGWTLKLVEHLNCLNIKIGWT